MLTEYLSYLEKKGKSPHTISSYRNDVTRFFEDLHLGPEDYVTASDVRKWVFNLLHPKEGTPLALDGFVILGTENILKINNEVAFSYGEDWINEILIFCKLIGEGNYLGVDRRNNEYRVLDCFHEELPESWSIIAEDFDEWLELLVLNMNSESNRLES